jgi:hypothetical protein
MALLPASSLVGAHLAAQRAFHYSSISTGLIASSRSSNTTTFHTPQPYPFLSLSNLFSRYRLL